MQNRIQIPDHIKEILDELPEPLWKYGDRKHPMWSQWKAMIDRCTNPAHAAFSNFGGRGITITHAWFDFGTFVEDMSEGFEIEPSKPPRLRANFLARRNLRAGFNVKNCYWTKQSEANQIQAKTIFIDTAIGKGLTFKQLSEELSKRVGEEWPEEVERHTSKVRTFDVNENRMKTVSVVMNTIFPIRWQELRRRHRLGLPLFAPVKPYGENRELVESLAADQIAEHSDNPNI